jgi:integrase
MAWSLFERSGERKYLSASERRQFRDEMEASPPEIKALCWLMLDTGCRISEALALKPKSIDFGGQSIVLESLKKRRRGVYRSVPVSADLLNALDETFGLRKMQKERASESLWPWHRMTAYRRIIEVMKVARIYGPQATPKGLRHGFAIAALEAGVPLNLVQRWLGHADMATTAIYANAMGAEERQFAAKMWESGEKKKPPQT